jgi:cytochrome c5
MSGETENNVSGWTVDTLHLYLTRRIVDLQAMLQERYDTQTKALDAALAAQQKATQAALIAADKAVQAALASAEKAVAKAEVSAEKRFEAVNAFREQLHDQANTFMPRIESEARIHALIEKVDEAATRHGSRLGAIEVRMQSVPTVPERDSLHLASLARDAALTERLTALELRITSRLDMTQGHSSGLNAGWLYLLGGLAAFGTLISIYLAFRP